MLTSTDKSCVLVLLAVYNGAKYLRQQIDSILNQHDVDVKLLIRDDGSTDESIDICREYAKHNSVTLLPADQNMGTPAGCFYKLILKSSLVEGFDYVAFADQDDVWCYDKLAIAIARMGESYSAYSSNLIAFENDSGRSWLVDKTGQQTDFDYIFQGASAGCTYVIKKCAYSYVYDTLGKISLDEAKLISHDWLVYAIVRSYGLKWYHHNSAYIFYRQHESNSYGDKRGIRLIGYKYQLLKSGWYRRHIHHITSLINLNSEVSTVKSKLLDVGGFFRLRHISIILKSRRRLKESIGLLIMILAGFV